MLSWERARAMALSLPGAEERDHFGSPSFRVKGKIFAQLSSRGKPNARALVKLSPADQAALTMSAPETFTAEPQWGRHGWTRVELATVEESMFLSLLSQSWKQVAPKRNAAAEAGKR